VPPDRDNEVNYYYRKIVEVASCCSLLCSQPIEIKTIIGQSCQVIKPLHTDARSIYSTRLFYRKAEKLIKKSKRAKTVRCSLNAAHHRWICLLKESSMLLVKACHYRKIFYGLPILSIQGETQRVKLNTIKWLQLPSCSSALCQDKNGRQIVANSYTDRESAMWLFFYWWWSFNLILLKRKRENHQK